MCADIISKSGKIMTAKSKRIATARNYIQ